MAPGQRKQGEKEQGQKEIVRALPPAEPGQQMVRAQVLVVQRSVEMGWSARAFEQRELEPQALEQHHLHPRHLHQHHLHQVAAPKARFQSPQAGQLRQGLHLVKVQSLETARGLSATATGKERPHDISR
jgi:hypothetical protein